ncbi:hypothetical protein ACHQM5_030217 [Ranunculus cassubicifolius]
MIFSCLNDCCLCAAAETSFDVGVILDLKNPVGIMSNICISIAMEDFYAVNDHYETRMVLHTKDSSDVVGAVFAAVDLLEEEKVKIIVGPQTSAEADFVAELGNKTQVPVVSFSATSPSITRSQMPYFVRMTQNDTYQLEAIASIAQKFKWKDVILIYEDSDYGSGIIPYLTDVFEAKNVRIPYKTAISLPFTEHKVLSELQKLSVMQTRVFIVHMSTQLGLLFFQKVNEIGLMSDGYAWIITEEMTSGLGFLDSDMISSMHGVLGIKPYIPRSEELNKFRIRISKYNNLGDARWNYLNIFCLHAYDTIWALAMAVERVCTNQSFREPTEYHKNISDIGELGISQRGFELLREILGSKFKGLSGEIHFVNGQLQPKIFQITNVILQGEKEIGFWSPAVGLSLTPDEKSQSEIHPIIWPGGSDVVPRSWVTPANGKILKIGYPVKSSFKEFVGIPKDRSSVAGYCIDVYKAVMEALPYVVKYEFVPFSKPNGETGSTYDELVNHVFLQKYDAAVGDITITANRSKLVVFSPAYTSGGVAMIVPIRYEKRNYFSVLTGTLSSSSLGSSVAALIFTVCSMCFSKRTSAWMLLSSIFSNSIHEVKKASKIQPSVFMICNLILVGISIVELAELLSGDSGRFMAVNAKELVKSGEFVGYQKDSYVKTVLDQLNFDESKIRVYNSPEEYDEALEKGSQNGGVAAIFDEIPYVKSFLNKFCRKYRRIGPIYRMEGFGFVFPRGSPLVPDVSRAIISLRESGKLAQIERAWLESDSSCRDPPTTSSNLLIWVLFLGSPFNVSILLFRVGLSHINKHSQNRVLKALRYILQINQDEAVVSKPRKTDSPNDSEDTNLDQISDGEPFEGKANLEDNPQDLHSSDEVTPSGSSHIISDSEKSRPIAKDEHILHLDTMGPDNNAEQEITIEELEDDVGKPRKTDSPHDSEDSNSIDQIADGDPFLSLLSHKIHASDDITPSGSAQVKSDSERPIAKEELILHSDWMEAHNNMVQEITSEEPESITKAQAV